VSLRRRRRRRRNRSESAGHVTDDVIGHLPLRRSSILGMRGKQCQPAGCTGERAVQRYSQAAA